MSTQRLSDSEIQEMLDNYYEHTVNDDLPDYNVEFGEEALARGRELERLRKRVALLEDGIRDCGGYCYRRRGSLLMGGDDTRQGASRTAAGGR